MSKLQQHIDEMENEILKRRDDFCEAVSLLLAAHGRMLAMEKLLDDAVRVFGQYLNVPEGKEIKDRWEQLKRNEDKT